MRSSIAQIMTRTAYLTVTGLRLCRIGKDNCLTSLNLRTNHQNFQEKYDRIQILCSACECRATDWFEKKFKI
jgi:hypothetical protein